MLCDVSGFESLLRQASSESVSGSSEESQTQGKFSFNFARVRSMYNFGDHNILGSFFLWFFFVFFYRGGKALGFCWQNRICCRCNRRLSYFHIILS